MTHDPEGISDPSYNPLIPAELRKLIPLAEALEVVEIQPDGSLYLRTKNHLIIESAGNQVFYSKTGDIVLKSNAVHLNPTTPINNVRQSADYVQRVRIDANDLQTDSISLISGEPNE